jgi:DUF1707 SHOCT-like domain
MAEPEGSDGFLAGHADREQVVQALKDAFVQGRLTRDELDVRAGQALTARTGAELATLTADLPVDPAAARPASAAARPSLLQRHPVAWAFAGSGGCLGFAFGIVLFAANVLDPAGLGNPYHPWSRLCVFAAFIAMVAGFIILVHGLGTAAEQRQARRQLPPGGQAGRGGSPGSLLPDGFRRSRPTCSLTTRSAFSAGGSGGSVCSLHGDSPSLDRPSPGRPRAACCPCARERHGRNP